MNLKGKNKGMRGSEKTAPSYSYGKSNLNDIRTFKGKNSIQNSKDFAKKLRSEGKKVTIIGDERGHTVGTYPNKKRPSSLGSEKTTKPSSNFSSRVKNQNQKAIKDAIRIAREAADQKLSSVGRKGGGMIYKDMGGLVGGQSKLDINNDGMITGQDFKMMSKKHGGKITSRMSGGQVAGVGYDD